MGIMIPKIFILELNCGRKIRLIKSFINVVMLNIYYSVFEVSMVLFGNNL